ncbi:PLP-dependent aminotransferase family protein [Streptomyces sp. NPDC001941]|uniref:aminotransferase-like domain-containing protein n=1 Tax=Streptomyces sp. NPDC001941 TaxID=3154659 RepID=UPI0033334DDA
MTYDAPRLDRSSLHASLGEPALGSIGFLNEVMGRYPDAISFAPGAPHPDLLEDVDPEHHTRVFLEHLVMERGWDPGRARRSLLEYGPSRGLIGDIVAAALRRDHAIDVPARAVVVTAGAQEGILLTLRALFASPDDLLAVVTPCFVGATGAARLLGIGITPVHETEQGVDLDGLRRACRAARADGRRIRACYVAPDFSNPGGVTMPLAGRRRLLDLAEEEDFFLVEDNAYGFTARPGRELPPLKALDARGRVIHVGTFAKVAFPGARVGYVVADQSVDGPGGPGLLADELAALKTMTTVNTSPLGQAVVGGMLLEHGGSLVELSRRKAELYQHNLSHLAHALDRHLEDVRRAGVTWNRPEGGFFLRMDLPVPADLALLERSAERYGVLWTPMAPFYVDGTGTHRLRLSCSYLDPEQIETGVERLAAFLRAETMGRSTGSAA